MDEGMPERECLMPALQHGIQLTIELAGLMNLIGTLLLISLPCALPIAWPYMREKSDEYDKKAGLSENGESEVSEM